MEPPTTAESLKSIESSHSISNYAQSLSHGWLSMTPWTIAHHVWLSMTPWTIALLCPWNFPGKNTGVGCHFLLWRIFPIQGSKSRLLLLLHCHADYLPLVPPGKPNEVYQSISGRYKDPQIPKSTTEKVPHIKWWSIWGFPGGASGKEPACQCRRQKRHWFYSWVRKIPWRMACQPTSVFLPEEYHG